MGAIAVSIFVSAVAVIGLICFNKKDKKQFKFCRNQTTEGLTWINNDLLLNT